MGAAMNAQRNIAAQRTNAKQPRVKHSGRRCTNFRDPLCLMLKSIRAQPE